MVAAFEISGDGTFTDAANRGVDYLLSDDRRLTGTRTTAETLTRRIGAMAWWDKPP